jgi:hypothetical protein
MFALTGPHVPAPVRARPAAMTISASTSVVHFGAGRHVRSFRMAEPAGVILRYRISAPAGARVLGWAQVPGLTVPLEIRTVAAGPSSACTRNGGRVTCIQGEEWCPMPSRTWRLRVLKLTGPAGDVMLRFVVGAPPG